MVIGAKRADAKSLRKIPSSDSGMYDQCAKDAGFVPYYVRDMQHPAAKKAFAFGFLLRICQGSEEVPVAMKHVRMNSIRRGCAMGIPAFPNGLWCNVVLL